MATCWIMHEQLFDPSYTGGTTTLAGATADSSYPLTNIHDWRLGGPWRFKPTAATAAVDIVTDLLSAYPVNTAVIGGHNWVTANAKWKLQHSDTATTGPWTDAFAYQTPTADNMPAIVSLAATQTHRYWRLDIVPVSGGTLAAIPELGIFGCGMRFDIGEKTNDALDAYGVEAEVDKAGPDGGSFLMPNVRYKRKKFRIKLDDPGVAASFFAAQYPGWLSFEDHALTNSRPFWFAWNYDVDPAEVYLCSVDKVAMPFHGSYKRRELNMMLEGYREVA